MCVCLFFCPASMRPRLCTHDVCVCVCVRVCVRNCFWPTGALGHGARNAAPWSVAHPNWNVRSAHVLKPRAQTTKHVSGRDCVCACVRMCRACFRLANCAGGAGVDVGWCSLTPHDRHASHCYIAANCSSQAEAPDIPAQGVSRHMAREQDTLPELGHAMPRQSGDRLLL